MVNLVDNDDSSFKDGNDSNQPTDYSPGCGVFGKYPLTSLAAFAIVGLGVGIGLSFWTPEDEESKKILITWLGLVGDIFVRALKCIVIPLVFCNVVLATVEMVRMGKASSIGWITIGVYAVTTALAAIFGVLATLMFVGAYSSKEFQEDDPPIIQLGCNRAGTFLTESTDGMLSCTNTTTFEDANRFNFVDISNSFTGSSSGPPDLSLSDTIYQGVFHKLVSSNIFASLADSDLLAVVFFAIVFGVALGRLVSKNEKSTLKDLMDELNGILLQVCNINLFLVLQTQKQRLSI